MLVKISLIVTVVVLNDVIVPVNVFLDVLINVPAPESVWNVVEVPLAVSVLMVVVVANCVILLEPVILAVSVTYAVDVVKNVAVSLVVARPVL